MDAKLKRKWLKALRSGEYRQGRGKLVSERGTNFCCLGVLADVMGCEWQPDANEFSSMLVPILPGARKPLASDGDEMLDEKRIGLSSAKQNKLAELNDGGAPFAVIADYIEKFVG